tara:strand:- start:304 stop:543 length:240 start_codon:yes stop_codon:yes gene_type:complete
MFAVVQKDTCVFGSGLTKEEALKDAEVWIDESYDDLEFSNNYLLVPCSPKLYKQIQLHGGDTLFIIDQGLAQTYEEFNR